MAAKWNLFRTQNGPLSKREIEVLKYAARGWKYNDIADALYVSSETVKSHIKNINEKLHSQNIRESIYHAFLCADAPYSYNSPNR